MSFPIIRVVLIVGAAVLSASRLFAAVPVEFQPDYDKGYDLGYPGGYKIGLASGKERGRVEGAEKGNAEGYQAGWSESYQPAFDVAYSTYWPVGEAQGWNEGLLEGYQEGLVWAPVFNAQVLLLDRNGGGSGFGYDGSDILSVSLYGGCCGSTIFNDSLGQVDWAKHYFELGYDEGYDIGQSNGDSDGYGITYPRAYADAYRVGHRTGSYEGTIEGVDDGKEDGLADGNEAGFTSGFDAGFLVGVQVLPWPEHLVRSVPAARGINYVALGASVPEPACLSLVGIGLALFFGRRCRRYFA